VEEVAMSHVRRVALVLRVGALVLGFALLSGCGRGPGAPQSLSVTVDADAIVLVGQSVRLQATLAADVDLMVAVFGWRFVERPIASAATLEADGSALARFVPDQPGVYELEVRVDAAGAGGSDRVRVTAVERGVRFEGDPGTAVLDASFDLDLPMVVSLDEVSLLPETEGPFETLVVRTELEIGLALEATIGEANALLADYDAWIVDMLPRQRQFVVRVPDPGSLDALDALVARLEAESAVEFVLPGIVGRAEGDEATRSALPTTTPANSTTIDHHLAVRLHAVWNLRALLPPLDRLPYLVIADMFGSGPPGPGFDVVVEPLQFQRGKPTDGNHGYHVLGIVAGAFDPVPGHTTEQDRVTGVVSVTLRVRAHDLQVWTVPTLSRQSSAVIRRIAWVRRQDPDARVVVNTSLNDVGHPFRKMAARSWVEKVRGADRAHIVGAGFEPMFLHLTSAGNTMDLPGIGTLRWRAVDNSFWAYAALGDLSRLLLTDYPNLTNVHVIENRIQTRDGSVDPATGMPARPLPGCANDDSIMGGTLSGMGTGVWSFGAAGAPNDGVYKDGTSMSTPQVAGVAVWAFALEPSLTGPELARLLRDVAQDRPTTSLTRGSLACNAVVPRPVVDAYDAVLAAGGARARVALLDLDGNGAFDERDLAAFVAAFDAGDGTRRYGRHDLNGDGRTGERERTERFDLDGDRLFGSVRRTILDAAGGPYDRDFDERAVNDDDVLCYYAYGPLFAGDATLRDLLVGDRCAGNPLLTVELPVDGRTYVRAVSLRARLDPPLDAPGSDLSGYRIYWSYPNAAGATVHLGSTSSGQLRSNVAMICPDVVLTAQARVSVGRKATDRVAFSVSDAAPGPWQATLVSPASHTVFVDAADLAAGVRLEGAARRMACSGFDTTTNDLRWLDEQRTLLVVGPLLDLPASAFDAGAGALRERSVTLRHDGSSGRSEALVRVVPCSSQPGSGLIPCPDAWPELRDDLVAKHDRIADLLDPATMREALLERLELTFGRVLPEPFPLATPALVAELENELPSILMALLERLLTETLAAPSSAEFDARLTAFAGDPLIGALTLDERAFLAETIAVAGSVQAFYAPLELGGDGGWSRFPFASEAARTGANPVVPAAQAARGFLHAYLLTNTSPTLAVGAYDLAAGRAAGRDSGMLGAIALLVEREP
jgi:hypothetical protein